MLGSYRCGSDERQMLAGKIPIMLLTSPKSETNDEASKPSGIVRVFFFPVLFPATLFKVGCHREPTALTKQVSFDSKSPIVLGQISHPAVVQRVIAFPKHLLRVARIAHNRSQLVAPILLCDILDERVRKLVTTAVAEFETGPHVEDPS